MTSVPLRPWGTAGGQWVRLPTCGDGNCFFYSLASSLNFMGYRDRALAEQVLIGRNLRERVLEGREREWDEFLRGRGFAEVAPCLADVAPCDVYVGDFVLNFVAWLLQLRIVVLTDAGGDVPLVFGDGPTTVTLAYFDDVKHFESVVCRDGHRGGRQALLRSLEKTARDGVGRSPNNARRTAESAVRPCGSGFTGVFLSSTIKAVAR